MQQVLKGEEGLACIKCGRPASFVSPLGALCPTDALMAAAIHGWIPAQISGNVNLVDGYDNPTAEGDAS